MKKNSVGILTFQFANNYGALLQCYALQEFIKSEFQCDVSVIKYNPLKMLPIKSRIVRGVMNYKQNMRFHSFRSCFFNLSNKNDFETIIVGSDQVWNPIINGYDSKWILPDKKYNRIVSYAASIGKSTFNDAEMKYFSENLDKFRKYKSISVRENDGSALLRRLGIDSVQVCDPVFLLRHCKKSYDDIISQSKIKIGEKYIFVYSLEENCKIDRISNQLKEKTRESVISVHPSNVELQTSDKFITDAGPCEFLYLLAHSSFVVTNSFHGLAFSIIFKKTCYAILHSSLSSRQKQLLDVFNEYYEKIAEDIYRVSPGKWDDIFQVMVEGGREYLEAALK